jgi:hypothetical protein
MVRCPLVSVSDLPPRVIWPVILTASSAPCWVEIPRPFEGDIRPVFRFLVSFFCQVLISAIFALLDSCPSSFGLAPAPETPSIPFSPSNPLFSIQQPRWVVTRYITDDR